MKDPVASAKIQKALTLLWSMIRIVDLARVLLIAAALGLWFKPVARQFASGWSTHGDLILLGAGAVLILAALLPRLLRANAAVLVGALAVIEIMAALAMSFSPRDKVMTLDPETNTPSSRYVVSDPDLGYKLNPGSRTRVVHTSDGRLIYDMTVTVDAAGRRSALGARSESADGFVAFFGDSFTQGVGVNDDQTFPFFVGTLMPRYSVYNYGVGGYGPQHTLALLDGRDLRQEIQEARGIGIYTYIDAHVRRAVFTVRSGTSRRSPYYVMGDDDSVFRNGSFNTSRPFLNALYEEIWPGIRTLSLLRVDFPPIDVEAIRLSCRLIVSADRRFRHQFKGSDFLVVFYPGRSNEYGAKVRECLAEHGVTYLDYSNEPWDPEFSIPYDGHPSARGHLQFAKILEPSLSEALKSIKK